MPPKIQPLSDRNKNSSSVLRLRIWTKILAVIFVRIIIIMNDGDFYLCGVEREEGIVKYRECAHLSFLVVLLKSDRCNCCFYFQQCPIGIFEFLFLVRAINLISVLVIHIAKTKWWYSQNQNFLNSDLQPCIAGLS